MKDRTILYVEDDDNIREGTVKFLRKEYLRVIAVDNCEDALNLYEDNEIDIIITDIYIDTPNSMDGLEMIKLIRKNDKYTPILVTTAYKKEDYLLRAMDLHLEGYLVKVFSRMELTDKLDRMDKILLEREKEEKEKIANKHIILSDTITYDPNNLKIIKNDIEIQLTHSENRLLNLLCKSKNQLIHYETIDDEFYHEGIALKALVHVLQKKLGKNKLNKNFIKNISKEGYKLQC
jgi:DNA-binding response OmpR family regulator